MMAHPPAGYVSARSAWKALEAISEVIRRLIFWAWSSILGGLGVGGSVHGWRASSAAPSISSVFRGQPKQINENVYEIRSPQTEPSVVVIFFHGFSLGDYREAYWTDWVSADGSDCWLETLLGDAFPGARVLSVSYDGSLQESSDFGRADLHSIAETLLLSLTTSAGANAGGGCCPVVLVGHSLGGLVMKKVVLRAAESISSWVDAEQGDVLENFLRNIKGLFFYATPHCGSRLAMTRQPSLTGPLVKDLGIWENDTARLHENFSLLQSKFQWKLYGLGELHETVMDGFRGVVVEQSSSMHGMAKNYKAIQADHISICKPDRKESPSFTFLEDFIKRILDEKADIGHRCQGLPDYPVELGKRAQDVQNILMDKDVVGIFGMGGIGKTTLAKTVYNNISKQFEYTCFVDHVKDIQIHALEDWLLHHFHDRGAKVVDRQWQDLKGKKTLIVMDDIDSVDQLAVLPKLNHFGNGSRLLMTSRDEGIVKVYDNYGLYEVEVLKMDEAKKLFCQNAFNAEEIPVHLLSDPFGTNRLTENVNAVVKICDGLPLTLEVIGRYLRSHDTDDTVWEETIDKLKRAESVSGEREDRVWASLRISYDALATEERDMFIEAATCFFQQPLDRALAVWSTSTGNSVTRWKNLLRRSMVKEVIRHKVVFGGISPYKAVWVHEQLRDLSWNLAKGRVVSGSGGIADTLVEQLNANEVKGKATHLQLSYPDLSGTNLQLDCLTKLKKLKYLDLECVQHVGSGENFPKNLSLLRWTMRDWKRKQIPPTQLPITLHNMNSLAVLELENFAVSRLFSDALSNLTNLRILSFSALRGLDHLPDDFGNLSRLKHVCLTHLRLSALPDSFGNLSALEHLTLDSVDVSELPESFGLLSSLVTLTIVSCSKLSSLPFSFGSRLTGLNKLDIHNCPLLRCLQQSLSV